MHRVPAHSFERLSSTLSLWQAWRRVERGKSRSPRIAAFHLDADREVFRLHRELRSGSYQAGSLDVRVVRDPKLRLVAASAVRDGVVHQALVSELAPHYEPSFIDHSYSCCRGRGPQRALLRYLGWARHFRYRLQLDIGRFYPSIEHQILLDLLFARLRDDNTRTLLRHLVTSGSRVYQTAAALEVYGSERLPPAGRGLALGSYLSHWCGDFYLSGLDHFVKRECQVHAYLRYADDFVLLDDDAGRLLAVRDRLAAWLAEERRLTLKVPGVVESTVAATTFLGYRVSRSGFRPGRKARRRMKERVRAAAAVGPSKLVRTLRSYRGLFGF